MHIIPILQIPRHSDILQMKLILKNSVPTMGFLQEQMIGVGDDSYLTDIDVANTLGIYGVQDSTQAAIKLGSNRQH